MKFLFPEIKERVVRDVGEAEKHTGDKVHTLLHGICLVQSRFSR